LGGAGNIGRAVGVVLGRRKVAKHFRITINLQPMADPWCSTRRTTQVAPAAMMGLGLISLLP
jgi:hypothetical protein